MAHILDPTPFSPSRTTDFAFCPLKRELTSKGWMTKRLSKRDISAVLGSAFARAMAHYNAYRMGNEKPDVAHCISVAVEEIDRARAEWVSLGRVVGEWDQPQVDNLVPKVTMAVTKYAANDPIDTANMKREHVELTLPESGNSRIDLGVSDRFGRMVIDYKCKTQLEAKWRDKEIERYRFSHQLYHYTHYYSKLVGEPINRFGICLVVCGPKFSAELIEYTINPEAMSMWLSSSMSLWKQMHDGVMWMNPTHESVFGACEFKRACLDFHLDENLMLHDYVKRGEKIA